MNGFGEFLYCLRREKRITQAELAEKLGVSNKAVSKWETGDAMPETSLLVPISKIFDVTVDELLNGERKENKEDNFEKENDEFEDVEYKSRERFSSKDHLFSRGKDDEESETLSDIVSGIVCTVIFLLGAAAYLVIGLTRGLWYPYWVIFPCCAFLCGIIGILFGLCDSKKREEKFRNGENPYTGAICGIIMLTCLITYLPLGAFLNLWHPCWAIPAVGGFLCGVVGTFGKIGVYKNSLKNRKENKQ